MGSLKPGATYIYERVDDKIYAREFGSTQRRLIGQDYPGKNDERDLWEDIKKESQKNPALQKAIENVIMIYRLSKDNPL